MKRRVLLLALTGLLWFVGPPVALDDPVFGGAAWAKDGGRGGSDDDGDKDDDRDSGRQGGSGGKGSGKSDSGKSGSGKSDSGKSGSGSSGSRGSDASGGNDRGSAGSGSSAGKGSGRSSPESGGEAGGARGSVIALRAADGSTETLRDGVYERRDARGRIVEQRKATATDRGRVARAADAMRDPARHGEAVSVVVVDDREGLVQLIDSEGWTETIRRRTYVLTDPNGNTVTRRRATAADRARMLAGAGQ